jgi:hypothetical protein
LQKIVIERDAKACFDALRGDLSNDNWVVVDIICNIGYLRIYFALNWVMRKVNVVAHELETRFVL